MQKRETTIVNYSERQTNLSDHELEVYFLFCVAVAGKRASVVARKVDALAEYIGQPFLKRVTVTDMRIFALGKYDMMQRMLDYFSSIEDPGAWLRTASLEDLLRIPAVGNKTARFFLTHCLGANDYAIIDTHVKRWLSEIGHPINGLSYSDLEKIFLYEAKKREMSPSTLDLLIWRQSSGDFK